MNARIFITGSNKLKELNKFQQNEIKQYLKENNLILLKNNYDIDYQIQSLCNNEEYEKVYIFSLLHKPNKIINKKWNMMFVPPKNNNFDNTINEKIISICDYAIMIYDTQSQEDIFIMLKLITMNKKIILLTENEKYILEDKKDLSILNKYL